MLVAFIAMNVVVSRSLGRGADFLIQWKGARTLVFEKGEPYSGATAAYVQEQVYGRSARQGEKPYILTTPFPIMLLYLPAPVLEHLLAILAPSLSEDGSIPIGIFLFLSELALILSLFVSIKLTGWQPRPLFRIALFLLSGLSLYNMWALLNASPVVLLGLIYVGILAALGSELDELAGGLMAISFYHWETGGPFMALVLLWIVARRRWKVLFGLFMALFILVVVSFFIYPDWLLPYMRAVLADLRWEYGFTPAKIFGMLWPEYGHRAGEVLSGIMIMLLAIEWAGTRKADFRRFHWTACLSLAAAPLVGLRGEVQNLVILLTPLVLVFAVVRERWKAGYWLSGLLLSLVFVVPWAILVGGMVPAALQQEFIYLFLPLFTVIGLYWTRWWSLRPARTWLERASAGEYR
jgi:hypothetical protein